jgi:NAD(P)-dependent dehydrogenase (short-subunit alcohol dehydrogenase family)
MDTLLRGKICLITGGTAGIGKATALGLAELGATVVIVGRNVEKGKAVLEEIEKESGNSALDFLHCDLSSQLAIRQLAIEVQKRYAHLDVLINNAGVFMLRRETTVDGLEMTFAVNHLAAFLLNNLLIDLLKASAPARIIDVCSDAQQHAKLELNDLQGEKHFNFWHAYGQSKLAMILCVYEQARRLAGSGVTINAVHPGFVATSIGQNNVGVVGRKVYRLVLPLIGIAPEMGAKTSIYLASSPDVETVSGKYFAKSVPIRSSELSYNETLQKQMWEISEKLVTLPIA